MVPTRELREGLLHEFLGHPRIFPPESMLWLGRPPTSQPKGTTWDEVLAQELEKQEHPARELLAECKKLQEALDAMTNALLKARSRLRTSLRMQEHRRVQDKTAKPDDSPTASLRQAAPS